MVLNLRLSVYGDAVRALLARGLKSKEDERETERGGERDERFRSRLSF